MSVQISLRMDETVVELTRKAAERENRSLANYIETLLTERLMVPTPTSVPIMSVVDDDADLLDAVAIDDDGAVDEEETERFRAVVTGSDKGGR